VVAAVRRFTAVTRPINYARQKTSRRVYVMIAAPWLVSLAISSPIALGLNHTARRADTPRLCTFYNSDFLIYSSMGSFYVPTVVMIVLYWRVYLVIRARRSVTTSSARGRSGPRPPGAGEESVSCLPEIGARRDEADQGSEAVLSAVAATLSAVQRRGEQLARRVASVVGGERTDSGSVSERRRRPGTMTLSPPIAVVEPDDDVATPACSSHGTPAAVPATAQLTPMSSPAGAVDACATPEVMSAGWNASTNATSRQQLDATECRESTTRRPATLSVPPAALEVSSLSPRRVCSAAANASSAAADSGSAAADADAGSAAADAGSAAADAGSAGANAGSAAADSGSAAADADAGSATADASSAAADGGSAGANAGSAGADAGSAAADAGSAAADASSVAPSMNVTSDEDNGETVMGAEARAPASAPAPLDDRVNGGRFVTFFNFTSSSKQRSTTASSAADRRLKRAVRRERRATKTLAIVLGISLVVS